MKRRINQIGIVLVIGILFCLGRLMQIQLFATESFSARHINLLEKSVEQRTHVVMIDNGRGKFVDRDGKELGTTYERNVVLFPFLGQVTWPVDKLAAILHISASTILGQLQPHKPTVLEMDNKPLTITSNQMEEINGLHIPGLLAIQKKGRDQYLAPHVIGLTGQNETELHKRHVHQLENQTVNRTTEIGVSGLQRTFDDILLTNGEEKLLYHVNQKGMPLFGNQFTYTRPANPFYPVVVETTIDATLQKKAEEIVNASRLQRGGLILLDVQTNEILALVSKPDLNTASQQQYQAGATNQMLQPHFPGSVFKTVIAAAAIEKGMKKGVFDCNTNPYGEGVGQHPMGMLSFEESFARSCNHTFASLAWKITKQNPANIETYARALGLRQTVGWQGDLFHFSHFMQFPEEGKNTIWLNERERQDRKAVMQTGIGQRNVRVSPLAVANMMATIARNGEIQEVKAVRKIQYKNGTPLYEFPLHRQNTLLSVTTIQELQHLLRRVVTSGTAVAYENLPYHIAGKTGTAQTGIDGKENRWFAAYFPYEQPRYVLVTVELETNGPPHFFFGQYVKAIAEIEKQREPMRNK